MIMEKLKLSDFGKIINDYYSLAFSSLEKTWFLEKEFFDDGEYTHDDYLELLEDIEKIKNHGVKDFDLIIEVGPYDDCQDSIAIFYGSFLDLFEDRNQNHNLDEYELEI